MDNQLYQKIFDEAVQETNPDAADRLATEVATMPEADARSFVKRTVPDLLPILDEHYGDKA